jgi:hypothetical protein
MALELRLLLLFFKNCHFLSLYRILCWLDGLGLLGCWLSSSNQRCQRILEIVWLLLLFLLFGCWWLCLGSWLYFRSWLFLKSWFRLRGRLGLRCFHLWLKFYHLWGRSWFWCFLDLYGLYFRFLLCFLKYFRLLLSALLWLTIFRLIWNIRLFRSIHFCLLFLKHLKLKCI